jgi:sterol desaturase/sphingolipid hydroxylase (fatty acid hydroxylase superfamily)
MVVTMMSINLFYQFWLHTQAVKRLPAVAELILNTPSHHRVHHGSNLRYLDCNHAGTLIIWDRLFGTFSEETEEDPIVYGLTKNLGNNNLSNALLHEYRSIRVDIERASKWRDKLNYLLLAPGWSHDGKDKRARVLRENANLELAR